MNIQFFFEKLYASETFKLFKKEHPSAFLTSGFFVFDRKGSDNKNHLDFYDPETQELFSFKLEEECLIVPVEITDNRSFEQVKDNYNFDFDDIEVLIAEKMQEEGVKNQIEKFLFSFQHANGKDMLLGTIFISFMGLLKVEIDPESLEIVTFEKSSFFDLVKLNRKKKGEEK